VVLPLFGQPWRGRIVGWIRVLSVEDNTYLKKKTFIID
jgi:hypothetical protein